MSEKSKFFLQLAAMVSDVKPHDRESAERAFRGVYAFIILPDDETGSFKSAVIDALLDAKNASANLLRVMWHVECAWEQYCAAIERAAFVERK
jgi:hypothetical protein